MAIFDLVILESYRRVRLAYRGEVVTVLYRGKEKARLMPLSAGGRRADLIPGKAFGMWSDRRDLRDVPGYVRKLRRGRFHDV